MKRPPLVPVIFLYIFIWNVNWCIGKYLDGKPWIVRKIPTFNSITAAGYKPDATSAAALKIAKKQFQNSLEKCITFGSTATPKCKAGGAPCGKGVKCANHFDAPYFCIEKGDHDTGNMSAGIRATAAGSFPTFAAKSEPVESGYTFAANLIGRALGLRSQMEVRPDFNKFIHRNDEALIQSMASLTESFGGFSVLKPKWTVKDIEALAQSVYARHCVKTVFTFDYPFDFRSIANSFSAFGDIGYMLAFHEPAAAYVARDRGNQWMLGYSQLTGPGQMISHFDVYKIMKDYDCPSVFKCKKPPRCRNFGYIDKDCECACAPGFSGHLCEIWSGDPYPRAIKAMCSASISKPMILSLGDYQFYTENKFDLESFGTGNGIGFYSQWCTVVIQAFGDKRPVIEPIANLFKDHSAFALVVSKSNFVYQWQDCSGMMTAQVLHSNATKRRVLCFSSIYPEGSPQIRPNRSDTSIDFNWLWTVHPKYMTPAVFKIKLGITYHPMPTKILRVFLSEREAFEHMKDDGAGMRSVGGVPGGAIAGTVVALLLIGGVIGGLFYVHKKKLSVQEMETVEVREDKEEKED